MEMLSLSVASVVCVVLAPLMLWERQDAKGQKRLGGRKPICSGTERQTLR